MRISDWSSDVFSSDLLKAMAAPQAWVLRDGRLQHIPSTEIVPGDLLRVTAGERIPADGRLLEAQGMLIDEAVLTGESVPIDKAIDECALSGTLVEIGRAWCRERVCQYV